jgi:hypothetical protein
VAPWFARAAFLIAAIWLEPAVAIPLAVALTVALKLFRSSALRGVEGRFTSQAWAEISFSVAGVTSLVIGWGLLGDPWLGFLPIAFMAWGDTASGLTRSMLPRSKAGSLWPTGHGHRLPGRSTPLPALLDWRSQCRCGNPRRVQATKRGTVVGRQHARSRRITHRDDHPDNYLLSLSVLPEHPRPK